MKLEFILNLFSCTYITNCFIFLNSPLIHQLIFYILFYFHLIHLFWVHETRWTSHWQCGRWTNIFHFNFYKIQSQLWNWLVGHLDIAIQMFVQEFFIKENSPFQIVTKDWNDGDKLIRIKVNVWALSIELVVWSWRM